MKPKKEKKVYPILAIRMTKEELAYIRREADDRNMKLSKYVKAILAPSWALVGNNNS